MTDGKVKSIDITKPHLNVVFIGHVDHGKSTVGGRVLFESGIMTKRELSSFKREASTKSREGWEFAWAFDLDESEREKGKTIEVGKAYFETEHKRITLLDAPGHKSYVPNMIGGTAQSDVAILVVSARKGEFEKGFEKGGQTREHAMLAKAIGVPKILVLVNKMDLAKYSESRYKMIVKKIGHYLKQIGYRDIEPKHFLPVSGLLGDNIAKPITNKLGSWYKGKTLFETLDEMDPPPRNNDGPLRIPVTASTKSGSSVTVYGKIESGTLTKDDKILVFPSNKVAEIASITIEDIEVEKVMVGDNVSIVLKNLDHGSVKVGSVLCNAKDDNSDLKTTDEFLARIFILEHKNSIISSGYKCIFHLNNLQTEATFTKILGILDVRSKKFSQKNPKFIKAGQTAAVRIKLEDEVALEAYKDFPQLGRFTLRSNGITKAVGTVIKVIQKKD